MFGNIRTRYTHWHRPLVVILCSSSMAAAGSEQPADNLEFIRKLFLETAARMLQPLKGRPLEGKPLDATNDHSVYLDSGSANLSAATKFLTNALTRVLTDSLSRTVYVTNASGDNAIHLSFKILRFDLGYRKIKAKGLAQREGSLLVDFSIRHSSTGQVLHQDVIAESRADTIVAKTVHDLELPELPITIGSWRGSEKKRKWLEPILIAVASGAIAYAFYSLRTQ